MGEGLKDHFTYLLLSRSIIPSDIQEFLSKISRIEFHLVCRKSSAVNLLEKISKKIIDEKL